mmetsp:Transcript_24923/g.71086  ORF Transcript_24923/g.71086 Transcript_24923/m.71086 type:complete len:217 (+) Transcript_24923:479-1129(+)
MLDTQAGTPEKPEMMRVRARDVVPAMRPPWHVHPKRVLRDRTAASADARPVLLDDHHPVGAEGGAEGGQDGHHVSVHQILERPLHPHEVDGAVDRLVLLQPGAREPAALRPLVAQVPPSLLQPSLARFDQQHLLAPPQEDVFGDAADPCPGVYGRAHLEPREPRPQVVQESQGMLHVRLGAAVADHGLLVAAASVAIVVPPGCVSLVVALVVQRLV